MLAFQDILSHKKNGWNTSYEYHSLKVVESGRKVRTAGSNFDILNRLTMVLYIGSHDYSPR